jgi:hypothetical protein
MPLKEGVLRTNIGIPMLIVVNKVMINFTLVRYSNGNRREKTL